MDISIIIVNFNTKDLLRNCINSILKHTFELTFEIIVVDNGSSDGSVSMVIKEFPQVILVDTQENLGFGKGNNIGVLRARGEFLFLLNSDTLLIENSIHYLHKFFIENEEILKIGALGCKLVDAELKIMNSGGGFPKVINDLKELYYLSMNKVFKMTFAPRDPYDFEKAYFEIDYVIGADLMMRKSEFVALKGFDERFFMYYEESDLQYRLRKKGMKCFVITNTQIIHLEGGSTNGSTPSNFKRIVNQESRNYYFKKNDNKMYPLYLLTDIILSFPKIFNRKYKLRENFEFIYRNIKSY